MAKGLSRFKAAAWDPLQGLSRVAGQFVPSGVQGLTVLSLDGQWLRLLHSLGRTSSRRTITTLLAHPIQDMSDQDVLAWLKQACAAKGIEVGAVLIANPSHLTTARLFTLPSVDPTLPRFAQLGVLCLERPEWTGQT